MVAVASVTAVVEVPLADAMGGDTSCYQPEYCISKHVNTTGGTDPNMSQGWTANTTEVSTNALIGLGTHKVFW